MKTKWWCVWRRRASAFADSVYRGPCINHLNDSVNPLTIGSERRRRLGSKSPIQNVRNAAGPTTTVGLAIAAIGCEHPKWKLALAKERAKKNMTRCSARHFFIFLLGRDEGPTRRLSAPPIALPPSLFVARN